jgi:hypothetical protein
MRTHPILVRGKVRIESLRAADSCDPVRDQHVELLARFFQELNATMEPFLCSQLSTSTTTTTKAAELKI